MADETLPTIAVEVSHPVLPEGFKSNLQGFIDWLDENAIFRASGSFLTGQIGGPTPGSNVGLYINGQQLMVWSGDGYKPIITVPVGAVIDWPGNGLSIPEFYMFAEGQLLNRIDHDELFAVIGILYNRPSDPGDSFRLPDYRGRYSAGAGSEPGRMDPKADGGGKVLTQYNPGTYYGYEWPTFQQKTPNDYTPRYSIDLLGTGDTKPFPKQWNKPVFNTVIPPTIAVRKIIRIL